MLPIVFKGMGTRTLATRRLSMAASALRLTSWPARRVFLLKFHQNAAVPPPTLFRPFCSDFYDPPAVDYEEFEALRRDETAVLLDVRNPGELESDGRIPGAVNVPIGAVPETFTTMDDDIFEDLFGTEKPSKNRKIVTFCKIGLRGKKAADFLVASGYSDVSFYPGSFVEFCGLD